MLGPTDGHQGTATCRWTAHRVARPSRGVFVCHSGDKCPAGAGQQPWASQQTWMQTLDVLAAPLLLWNFQTKVSWSLPLLPPHGDGQNEPKHHVTSLKAQLSPTLGFGRTGSPLDSQQLPGFLFILNLMCDWQQSSSGFSNELREACSWEFGSLANSSQ